jgi:glycosylphosphatidylinositol transamidase
MTAANPIKDIADDQPLESQSGETASASAHENDQAVDESPKELMEATKKRKKLQRLVRILLVLPYVLGILWTSLHPIVSVITGELKCRGWYLDEHSIETRFTLGQNAQLVPSHLQDLNPKPLRLQPRNGGTTEDNDPYYYSLCDFFATEGDPSFNGHNLVCHKHGHHFEMALIKPLSNAIDASEEAVVLVVPRPDQVYRSEGGILDWNSSVFHKAVVKSIQHLADPVDTPWLAKAVVVVTPTMSGAANEDFSLEQTVSSFLDAYSGRQTVSRDYQRHQQQPYNDKRIPQLPPRLSGAILRNLFVLDVQDDSRVRRGRRKSGSTDLSILPQGRRGVLPNADMVFLVGKLMEKTLFYTSAEKVTFLAHPYAQDSKNAGIWTDRWIDGMGFLASHQNLKKKAKTWAQGMIDVGLFAKTLAVGPHPPHAPALERGIDSLTIRVSFGGVFHRDPSVEVVQHTEYIIRSLANLHERLHHSFTLYLLPNPRDFVSHIEYLLPNILVLLPLAVRVFGMLLPSMTRGLDLTALKGVLLTVLGVVVAMFLQALAFGDEESSSSMVAFFVLLYAGVAFFWVTTVLRRNHSRPSKTLNEGNEGDPGTTRTILTVQFVTCAITVYILVPIAFCHASLSYLPSVVWTPLLAFPDYPSLSKRTSKSAFQRVAAIPMLCLLVVATAPPLALVPSVFSGYTPFVRYAYMPIHVLFFLLVTSVIVS